jgi:molybdopterin-containing oxidoreductase family iron-sulfur binding subunit
MRSIAAAVKGIATAVKDMITTRRLTMSINRRNFLSLAGCSLLLGAAGKTVAKASASHKPGTGKRYGMVIDLKMLHLHPKDMDRCIEACHSLHNVPKIDLPEHEIKWIWKEDFTAAFVEQDNHRLPEKVKKSQVLLLCNHCNNPACVSVCPTKATWKREDGIVMMDWHRCIGCRYCMAACPYGSRSFNWDNPRKHLDHDKITDAFPARMKGVVEKCTFCDERIARGKEPACVEACTSRALVFGDLNDRKSEIRHILDNKFSIKRKAELGTEPEVYYLLDI